MVVAKGVAMVKNEGGGEIVARLGKFWRVLQSFVVLCSYGGHGHLWSEEMVVRSWIMIRKK